MTTICVFGDSIAYGAWDHEGGWVSRLRKHLDEKTLKEEDTYYEIYNLGVSGDTTADLLKRFDSEISARKDEIEGPEGLVILFAIGINDPGMLHAQNPVSQRTFEKNIETLIKKARVFTRKIVFLGGQPVDETKTHPVYWNKEMHYDNKSIQRDNLIIRRACAKNNAPFVDLYGPFGKEYQKLLEDGVHPNDRGHDKIYKAVKSALIEQGLIK